MKVRKIVVSALLACVLLAGGIGLGEMRQYDAQAETAQSAPASVTLDEATLNAGTVAENPWKKMFDYWSDAGSVTYTEQGAVIEGTKGKTNAMNLINGPMSIADGSRFEMTVGIPYYNTTEDMSGYARKMVFRLFSGSTIASVTVEGDGYNAETPYVLADFTVGSATVADVHVPKAFMEQGGGAKFGFDLDKGWYAEVVAADGKIAYQAVDSGSAFTSALAAIASNTEVTRVQAERMEDLSKTRLVVRELNGQSLCLVANASTGTKELAVSESFNISSIKQRESKIMKGKTYTFELVSVAANNAAANTTQPENDPSVYVLIHLGLMGDIGWNSDGKKGPELNSGIWVTLTKQDGSVVSETLQKGSWGKAGQAAISFTPPEAGNYTLKLTFVTGKGYVTVRTLDFTAYNEPYIGLSGELAETAYLGKSITLPTAALYVFDEASETPVTTTVTYGSTSVPVTDGTFTPVEAGEHTVTYTASYEGQTYKAERTFTAEADVLMGITVTTPPTKGNYIAGETFDRAGMVVTANYQSGDSKAVTEYTVAPETLSSGTTYVTITYMGQTVQQAVTVSTPVLKAAAPAGTLYTGQSISVPAATLSVNDTPITEGVTIAVAVTFGTDPVAVNENAFTPETKGTYTVRYTTEYLGITYENTLQLTIEEDYVTSITIGGQYKTEYEAGESFDPAGMTVTAGYASGKRVEGVTGYTVSPDQLATSTTQVTISYMGQTATVTVSVSPVPHIALGAELPSVLYVGKEITLPTAKLVDADNSEIASAAITITVTYGADATPVTVTGNVFKVERAGDYTIKYSATYDGKTYPLTKTITAKLDVVTGIEITTAPTKVNYIAGETFDPAGMVVKATYESGDVVASVPLDELTLPTSALAGGTASVTVTYAGKTTQQAITVSTPVLKASAPTGTLYAGQSISVPAATLSVNNSPISEGVTITVAVSFGGAPVSVVSNAFTPTAAGTYVIKYSVTYLNLPYETTLELTVVADEVVSISITTPPTKVNYIAGETFDPAGMVVSATYQSGKVVQSVPIADLTLPQAALTEAMKSASITYMGQTVQQAITVSAPVLKAAAPAGTLYTGQSISVPAATLSVNETPIDGVTITVAVTFGGEPVSVTEGAFTPSAAGKYLLKYSATYLDLSYETSLELTVVADSIMSIRITTPPTKTNYEPGESFDKTGMVVVAVYASGAEVEITDYTVSKDVLAEGDSSVVISYEGKKTPLVITVQAPAAEDPDDPVTPPEDDPTDPGETEGSGGCGGAIVWGSASFIALAVLAALGTFLFLRRSTKRK